MAEESKVGLLEGWFANAYNISCALSPYIASPRKGVHTVEAATPNDDAKLLIVARDIFSLASDCTLNEVLDLIAYEYRNSDVTFPIKSNDVLIEVLLVHAVSKKCRNRAAYLHGIITLDEDVQEYCKEVLLKYPSKEKEESPSDDEDDDDDDNQNFDHEHDRNYKNNETKSTDSSRYCHSCVLKEQQAKELQDKLKVSLLELSDKTNKLDTINADLQEQVQKDIDDENRLSQLTDSVSMLERELKTASDKVLESDIILFEKNNQIKNQDQLLKDAEQNLLEVNHLLVRAGEENKALIDTLEATQPKADLYDKEKAYFQKLKDSLQEMDETRIQLQSEQKGHNETYTKLVAREKEVAALSSLVSTLDEFRSKASTMDSEMEALQREIAKQKDQILSYKTELSAAHSEVRDSEIRYQLLDEELSIVSERCRSYECDGGVGDGSHEVNPLMMRELLKLRADNKAYKEVCDKISVGNLERLERALKDEKHLTASLHAQWMSVKEDRDNLKNKIESADGFGHNQMFGEDEVREVRKQYEVEMILLRAKLHDSEQQCAKLAADTRSSKNEAESAATKADYQIKDLVARLKTAESECAELTHTNRSLEDKLLVSASEDFFREGRKVYQQQVIKLEKDLLGTQERCNNLQASVQLKESDLKKLRTELEAAKKQVEVEKINHRTYASESQQKMNELNVGNKVQGAMLQSMTEESELTKHHLESTIASLRSQLHATSVHLVEMTQYANNVKISLNTFQASEHDRAQKYKSFEIDSSKAALEDANKKIKDLSVQNQVQENTLVSTKEALSDLRMHTDYEINALSKQLANALAKANDMEAQLNVQENLIVNLTVSTKIQEASLSSAKQELLDTKLALEAVVNEANANINVAHKKIQDATVAEKLLANEIAAAKERVADVKKECDIDVGVYKASLSDLQRELHGKESSAAREKESLKAAFDEDVKKMTKELTIELGELTAKLAVGQEKINALSVTIKVQEVKISESNEVMAETNKRYESELGNLKGSVVHSNAEVESLAETIKMQEELLRYKDGVVGQARKSEMEVINLRSLQSDIQHALKEKEKEIKDLSEMNNALTLSNKVQQNALQQAEKTRNERTHSFENDTLALKKQLADAQREISEYMVNNKVQENSLVSVRNDLAEMKRVLEHDKANSRTLVAEASKKNIELKEAKKRLEIEATNAYSDSLNMKSDLNDKQEELNALTIKCKVLDNTTNHLRDQLASAKAQTEVEISTLKSKLTESLTRMELSKAQISEKDANYAGSYEEQSKEMRSVVKNLATLRSTLHENELKLKILTQQTVDQIMQINELTTSKKVQDTMIADLKEKLDELRKQSEDEIREAKADLSNSQTKINEVSVTNKVQNSLLTSAKTELAQCKALLDIEKMTVRLNSNENYSKLHQVTEKTKSQESKLREAHMSALSAVRMSAEQETSKMRTALTEAQEKINELMVSCKVLESESRAAKETLVSSKKAFESELLANKNGLADALSKIEVLKETKAMHENMFRTSRDGSVKDSEKNEKALVDAKTQLSELQGRLHEMETNTRVVSSSLLQTKDKLADTQYQNTDLQKQNKDLAANLEEISLSSKIQDMTAASTKEKISENKAHHEADLKKVKDQLIYSTARINELLVSNQVQASLLQATKDELSATKEDFDKEKAQNLELQAHLLKNAKNEGLFDQKRQLDSDVSRLTLSLTEAQNRLTEVRAQNRMQEQIIDGHKDEVLAKRRSYDKELNDLRHALVDAEAKIASLTDTTRMLKMAEPQLNLLSESQMKINELTVLHKLADRNLAETKLELAELRKRYESEIGTSKAGASGTQRKISELLEINVVQENELKVKEIHLANLKEDLASTKKNHAAEVNSLKDVIKDFQENVNDLTLQSKLHQSTIKNQNQEIIEVKRKMGIEVAEAKASASEIQGKYSEYAVSNKVQESLLLSSKDELLATRMRFDEEIALLKKYVSEVQVELNVTKETNKAMELDLAHFKDQHDEATMKVQELSAINKVQERMLAASDNGGDDTEEDDFENADGDALQELADLEVHHTKSRLSMTQSRINETKNNAQKVAAHLRTLEGEMQALRNSTGEEILRLKYHVTEAQLKVNELSDLNRILDNQFKSSVSKQSELEAEAKRSSALEVELINVKSQLDEANLKLNEFSNCLQDQEKRVAAQKKELYDLKKVNTALQMEHGETVQKLELKHTTMIEQVTRDVRTEMKTKVEKYLSDLGEENERLEEQLQTAQADVKSLRALLNESHEEIQRLTVMAGLGSPVSSSKGRLSLNHQQGDDDAVEGAKLLSRQEAKFGINMFDAMKASDETQIQKYIKEGFPRVTAIQMVFEQRYGSEESSTPSKPMSGKFK